MLDGAILIDVPWSPGCNYFKIKLVLNLLIAVDLVMTIVSNFENVTYTCMYYYKNLMFIYNEMDFL